jgi:peptide/nickel transport system substrate-binding protein
MRAYCRPIAQLVLLALLVSAILPACAPPATPTPAKPADSRPTDWNVVIAEQTGGADPLTEYGTNSMYLLIPHVLEPLMHIELLPDGKSWGVVNDLAERWAFEDPTTFVANLKQGVQFQNGEELTAEHVKYAYDAIVNSDKPSRRAILIRPLGEAEVVDKYTIRWHLPSPSSSVLATLFFLLIPPLERRNMTAEEFEAKPIGTGPYKVLDWPRDGTVRLEAWDGYRKGKPFPDKLTIRTVPEPSTRVLELLAGTAQIVQTVPIESLGSIEGNPKLSAVSLKGSSALSYVLNVFKTTPPFRDKRVRQAMNYAVDKDAIVRSILGGHGASMPGPLWPGWLGYTEQTHPYPYDPERARALLREAGYPDGFSFRWSITQGVTPKDSEIAQAVASQLAQVGIQAQLQPLERARLLSERNEGDFDMTSLIWPVSWHPAVIYSSTLNTSFPDAKLAPRWGDTPPELAEARRRVGELSRSTNVEGMQNASAAVNQLMHEEAFWLFVQTTDDIYGVQKDTDWRPYPTSYPPH